MPAPASDAAQRLSEQRKCRQQVSLARLKKEREAGQISMRDYLRGQADVEQEEALVSWANEVIKAIENKDLPKVPANIVSNPTNTASMRFMEQEYGVRLNNQPSAQAQPPGLPYRRHRIRSRSPAEARRNRASAAAADQAKGAARAAERVEHQMVIFEGRETSWKAVIDTLIALEATPRSAQPRAARRRSISSFTRRLVAGCRWPRVVR